MAPSVSSLPSLRSRCPLNRIPSNPTSISRTSPPNQLTMSSSQLSSKRASTRFSTYSTAPSVANTVKTSLTSDSAQQEIKDIEDGLEKLANKKLQSQRFVPTAEKTDNLSKLALGAKLDRALGRRMGSQDAVMKVKKTAARGEENEKFKIREPEKAVLA
jgi:arsenate reductase-like glutaredoxin family protein